MAGERTARPVPLLERDAELAALAAAVAAAQRGRGSVVLIEGEAGIGKSSLIRAFLAGLPAAVDTLVGGCDDLLAPRALGPLHEAVRGRRPGPLAVGLDGPVEEVYDAAVAQLAGNRTTVLVVEDLHWGDDGDPGRAAAPGPADREAARGARAQPARRGAAHRTPGAGPARRAGHRPGRDAPAAGAAVAGRGRRPAAPVGRNGAAIHRGIGGNPFYVTETLAAPPGALPESVADAVQARMRVLDEASVAAVEQLAVMPSIVDPLLAKALLGDRLVDLAAAEERGIIEVRPAGLAFRHELARRAVEAWLPGLRRRALHLAVVRALRELGASDAERLVHHAAAAGDAATIVEFAPAAARAAAAGGSHTRRWPTSKRPSGTPSCSTRCRGRSC